MTAAIVVLIVLLSTGCGWCLGVLWLLHSRRLAERDDARVERRAVRIATLSYDLACTRGMTLAEAETAILKAMQTLPSKAPR